MSGHRCDPSPDPRGGVVTRARVLRMLLECIREGGDFLAVLDEFYGCPRCAAVAVFTLAGIAVGAMGAVNPDVALALELDLIAAEAEIGR